MFEHLNVDAIELHPNVFTHEVVADIANNLEAIYEALCDEYIEKGCECKVTELKLSQLYDEIDRLDNLLDHIEQIEAIDARDENEEG